MDQFLGLVSQTSFLEIWLPPCRLSLSFSLSLPLLFRLILWSVEAHPVYLLPAYLLPWLLRPTQDGAQGGASSAIQAGAGGLRRWCKPLVSRFY